jgi:methylaspartate mutase sigma subunit
MSPIQSLPQPLINHKDTIMCNVITLSTRPVVDVDGARPIVILGVAASDAHAVANQLIAQYLRSLGYRVINLGTCTTVTEFADAADAYPEAIAVIVGSLNGHVYEDLRDLSVARAAGRVRCPVIVGGNLSVGSRKDASDIDRLFELGVDHVLADVEQLPVLLTALQEHVAAAVPVPVAS